MQKTENAYNIKYNAISTTVAVKRIKSLVSFLFIIYCITLFGLLALCGCAKLELLDKYKDPWNIKQEDNGWYYYIRENEDGYKYSVILGLVNDSENIDKLIIPEILGGYAVKRIGEYYCPINSAPYKKYGIDAATIENIIIDHDIDTLVDCGFKNFSGNLIVNAQINSFHCVDRYGETFLDINSVQINTDAMDHTYDSSYDGRYILSKYRKEYNLRMMENHYEIVFDADDGTQKTYYSIVKKDTLCTEPQSPSKRGYEFVGWYKESQCINSWDFSSEIVTGDITLYAKWNKV